VKAAEDKRLPARYSPREGARERRSPNRENGKQEICVITVAATGEVKIEARGNDERLSGIGQTAKGFSVIGILERVGCLYSLLFPKPSCAPEHTLSPVVPILAVPLQRAELANSIIQPPTPAILHTRFETRVSIHPTRVLLLTVEDRAREHRKAATNDSIVLVARKVINSRSLMKREKRVYNVSRCSMANKTGR
jgi:hypothetical protein